MPVEGCWDQGCGIDGRSKFLMGNYLFGRVVDYVSRSCECSKKAIKFPKEEIK